MKSVDETVITKATNDNNGKMMYYNVLLLLKNIEKEIERERANAQIIREKVQNHDFNSFALGLSKCVAHLLLLLR